MKNRRHLIGVIGAGDNSTDKDREVAFELGRRIAKKGWILLNGGRNVGIMNECSRGASDADGTVVGILPDSNNISAYVDIPIDTGLGNARNAVLVKASKILIAVGWGAGTLNEIALAIKEKKHLILIDPVDQISAIVLKLGDQKRVHIVQDPKSAVKTADELLSVTPGS